MGQSLGRVLHRHVVRVDKIGMITGLEVCKHRMRVIDDEVVPAHMRHLQRGIRGGDARHLTGDPVQSRRVLVFAAQAGHQLHADADAQKGARLDLNGLYHRIIKPAGSFQCCHTGGERPVSGQHDPVCACHNIRIRGHRDVTRTHFARHAFKRFVRRVQIAGLVINDCGQHRLKARLWSMGCLRPCADQPLPLRAARGPRI